MAHLLDISLYNFRNFTEQHLVFCPEFNFVFGPNASGKTSLLEAIYLLSRGKSFRTSHLESCIAHTAQEYVVRAQVCNLDSYPKDFWLALQRDRAGVGVYKVAQSIENRLTNFVKHLPVQFIDINTYKLIEEGPALRREYLDWLLFHTIPGYGEIWQRMKKSLEQRNTILKACPVDFAQLSIWTKAFVLYAQMVAKLRQDLVNALTAPLSRLILEYYENVDTVAIKYLSGWDETYALEEVLELNLRNDLARKNTSSGPHRADLEILIDNYPVKEVFSRGQTKLLTCLMMLARLQILANKSIFLIDDLSAELDPGHIGKFLNALASLKTQVIITALDQRIVDLLLPQSMRQSYMLHNEQFIAC